MWITGNTVRFTKRNFKHSRNFVISLIYCLLLSCQAADKQENQIKEVRVVIENQGWKLVGDLCLPPSEKSLPVVLMLNKADGDRTVYKGLAEQLAESGFASLRLDLRGHGESVNLGKFIPYKEERSSMIWDSEADVMAVHEYLKSYPGLDSGRIAIIGGSYSGEEMAEAGRLNGYAQAYVALSPGSFSDESIIGMDESGVPWLFIVSNNERHLKEITASVQEKSKTVELLVLPGTAHATNLLTEHPGLAERIAVWINQVLGNQKTQ